MAKPKQDSLESHFHDLFETAVADGAISRDTPRAQVGECRAAISDCFRH